MLASGAYSAPPDLLAGGQGANCPSPKTPTLPASAFGLDFQPYMPHADFGPSSLVSFTLSKVKFWLRRRN